MSASTLPYAQAFALDDNALPSGGIVVGGSAGFDYTTPNELHVNQNTDRVVINWDSFNIGQNALTEFHQNSSSSIAVNRVTGAHLDPTQILGTLKANGRIIVLDRNGVIFGNNSVVNVGGIIASTGDIDDSAFMHGDTTLKITGADQGQIVLNGQMSVADAGLAAFVAPTVINNGIINAKLGKVDLAGATTATLDLYGDGLTEVAVPQDDTKTFVGNTGVINAEGGRVTMTAAAAKKVVDSTVNMSGVVNVASVTQKGGKIILSGDTTTVSGKLDASGKTGGGEILVGGDYQGGGSVKHATKTNVTSTAVLKADTTGDNGDGGKVVLWSDDATIFEGDITARGGRVSGNGGIVETSGKKNLGVSGSVDASAYNGRNGEWLLDPSNVIISASTGTGIAGTGGTINPPSDSYTIRDLSIQNALNNGNSVTITTTNAGGTQTGNITTSGAVSIAKTTGGDATLTFQADGSIDLTSTTISSTAGLLNIVVNADHDANQDGYINITSGSISTNGGYFVAGGGSGTLWGADGIKGTADDMSSTGADNTYAYGNATSKTGFILSNSSINAGGGDIYITAKGVAAISGGHGITMVTGTSLTTSGFGAVKIKAQGGDASASSNGANLKDITAGSGGISIVATRGTGTASAIYGTYLAGNLTATGGAITINGGTGGINLSSDVAISSGGGNITLNSSLGFGANKNLTINTGTGIFTTSGIIGSSSNLNNFTVTASDVVLGGFINATGTILLKPYNVSSTIGLGGGTGTFNLSDTELGYLYAGSLIIGDSAAGTGDIIVDSWDLSGKTHSVELYGNDITFQDTASAGYSVKLGTGNFLSRAKDNGVDVGSIFVNSKFVKAIAGSSNLDLLADRDVIFTASNIDTSVGSLNVQLNSDRNANQDGYVALNGASAITTNGGYFIAGGGSGTLFGADGIYGTADDAASTGTDNVMAWGGTASVQGFVMGSSASINANGGNIILSGHGGSGTASSTHGVGLSGVVQTSGTGSIKVVGTGGGTGSGSTTNAGIYITNAITSGSGGITMTGIGGGDSSGTGVNYGVQITGAISSANGAISITGTGGSGSGGNRGIRMATGGSVNAGTNTIFITGISGANTTEDFNLTAGTIGGVGQSGGITLNGDTFTDAGTTISTTGILTVKPRTVSTTIGLGGGTGTLNLDDSELAYLSAGTLIIGDSVNGTGDIVVDSWDLSAKTHGVELYGNDITFQDTASAGYAVKLGTGDLTARATDAGADVGTITVNKAFLKSVAGSSKLDLLADSDVVINSANITATTGLLNVQLNSDRNANQDGSISLVSTNITTNGGYFVAGGGAGAIGGTDGILGNGDGTGADDATTFGNSLTTQSYGIFANFANVQSGTGKIILNGKGGSATNQAGAYIVNTTLNSTSGDISINGYGGTGGSTVSGLNVTSSSNITSTSGNINIAAYAGGGDGSGGYNDVLMINGSTIKTQNATNASGNISITGDSTTSTATVKRGIDIWNGATIETNGSNISIIGTSGSSGAFAVGTWQDNVAVRSLAGGDVTIAASAASVGKVFSLNTPSPSTNIVFGGAGTANLYILFDSLSFNTTITPSFLGQNIYFKPVTTSRAVTLGNASGTGLNLTDAMLGYISASNKLVFGDSALGTGDIIVDTWDLSGKTHNVELYGNDITFQDTDATTGVDYSVKLGTGNFMAYAKDAGADVGTIAVNSRFIKAISGSSKLDLLADRDIVFTSANLDISTGSLNVQLNSDLNANQDGAVYINNSSISTNGGYFVAGGGSGTLFGADGIYGTADDTASTGADNVAAWGNATYVDGISLAGSTTINTSGGSGGFISLNGHGAALATTNNYGLRLFGGSIGSGGGAMRFVGIGGGTGASSGNYGVSSIMGIGSSGGAIDIIATGGTGTGGNHVGLRGSTGVFNSGAGALTITASGNAVDDVNLSGMAFGGVGQSGNITFNVNTFTNTGSAISSTGTVTIKPRTASTTIGIGSLSSTALGTLDLTDVELAYFTAGTLIIGDSVNGTGDIVVDTWDLSGKTHNLELYGNDIAFQDTDPAAGADYSVKLGSGNFTARAKDNGADVGTITATSRFVKALAGSSRLDLLADRDVIFSTANIDTTIGSLNVQLNSDRNANQDGAISIFNSNVTTNGGYIIAGGGSGTLFGVDGIYGTADDIASTGADNVAAWGNVTKQFGVTLSASTVNTGTGNIIMKGHGWNADVSSAGGILATTSSQLLTTSGNILITGTGGDATNGNSGGVLLTSSSLVQTQSGNINFKGFAGAADSGVNNAAVYISSSTVKSTGTGTGLGSITLEGTAVAGTQTQAFNLTGGMSINSADADINLYTHGPGGYAYISTYVGSTIQSTGSGNVLLDLTASSAGASYGGSSNGVDQILANTGNITIIADAFSMNGYVDNNSNGVFDAGDTATPDAVTSTSGNVYIRPYTAGRTIGVGGALGFLQLTDVTLSTISAGNKLVIGDASSTGDVFVDTWDLSGKTHNVELYGNDITFQDTDATAGVDYSVKLGTGNFSAYAKDVGADVGTIAVNSRLVKALAGSSKLDLLADRDIIFASSNIDTSVGSLNVQLNSDRNGNNDGLISINNSSAITTNGGYVVMGGGAGTLFGSDGIYGTADDAASTGADKLMAWGNANNHGINIGSAVNAGGGNIIINGHGGLGTATSIYGVTGSGNITTSGTGNISINGTGGGSGASTADYGIGFLSGNITTAGGNINILATGGTGTSANSAFRMGSGSINSGSGAISITGISGVSGTDFFISGGTIGGAGQSGTITLNGDTFSNTGAAISTTGSIIVKPRTASRAINLGGPTGGLDINDAALTYFNAGTLIIGDSVNGTGDIIVDTWDLSGKTDNVELYGNDITFQDTDATAGIDYAVKLGTGNFLARAKDNGVDVGTITATSRFVKAIAGLSRLDLLADRDVVFNGPNIDTSIGSLNIQFNGDRNADQDGAIAITGTTAITTNGGYFVAGGGSGTLFGADGIYGTADDSASTGADNVATWGNATYTTALSIGASASISTGTGNLILNAQGSGAGSSSNYGIAPGGNLSTTSGSIIMKGTGGSGGTANYGVIIGSTANITSASGVISITGTGGSVGTNYGIRMSGGNVNSGSGETILTGITPGADFNLSAGTIGGTGQTGNITINANTFANTGTAFTTTGTITVKPRTASTTIGIGGATSLGTLDLNDAELGYFNAGTLIIGDAVNGTGDVVVDSWDLSGKTNNVELYGNDIGLQDAGSAGYGVKLGTGNFLARAKDNGADVGTIAVGARFVKSIAGTSYLGLLADRDVQFNNVNIDTSIGSLNVELNGDRNANQDGGVALLSSSYTTNGGWFVAGGGSGTLWGADGIKGTADDAASTGTDNVAAYGTSTRGSGIALNSASINTGTGDVILNGAGYVLNTDATGNNAGAGILLTTSSITTTSGAVKLTGVGGGTGASGYNFGLWLANTSGITSASGNITLKGTGGTGTFGLNSGILLSSGTVNFVKTTTGQIDVTATAGGAGTNATVGISSGYSGAAGGGFISNGSGSIKLTATSGGIVLGTGAGGASDTGDITLLADAVDLTTTNLTTTGKINILPYTASTTIGLGGGSGTLNLTDAELGLLNAGTLVIGDAANGTGDIIVDSWDLSGKIHGVELYGNDITFQDTGSAGYSAKLGTGNFTARAKDNGADVGTITVNSRFLKALAGASKLDLLADRDIAFTNANIDTSIGSLNVQLNGDRNANQDGAVKFNTGSAVTTNGGYVVMGGGSGTLFGADGIYGTADDATSTGADKVAAWGNTGVGFGLTINGAINAGGGNIILNGHGGIDTVNSLYGIQSNANVQTSGLGTININATGGGTGASVGDYGLSLISGNIITGGGAINITATGGTGANTNTGFRMSGGSINSGTGTLTITGILGSGSVGTDFGLSAGTIGGMGQSGTITLNGDTFGNSGTTITSSGSIVLKPRTASRAINIGGTTGGLDISDAALTYFNAGTLIIGDSVNGTGDIIVDTWDLSGKTHNVELYGNDITFQDTDATAGVDYSVKLGTGNFTARAKDVGADVGTIAVNSRFVKALAGSSKLDLLADRDIVFTSSNIDTSVGSLNVQFNADRNADQDGSIYLSSSAVTTNGGYFVAGGGSGTLFGADGIFGTADDAASTGADNIAAWGNNARASGIYLLTSSINTGTGNLLLKGQGYAASTANAPDTSAVGVNLKTSSLTTTGAGLIAISGIAGGTGAGGTNIGVYLRNDSTINSSAGAITINGTGGGGSSGNNNGIAFSSTGANSINTVSGAVNLTGVAGTGGSDILINSTSGGIFSTGSGTITLNAAGTIVMANTTIGGNADTGSIRFNASDLNFSASAIKSSSTITVTPYNSVTSIGLGGGSGTLNLSDAELAMFTAATLIIGDSANGTGDIIVDSWDLSGKTNNVELYGNDITFQDTDATAGVDYSVKLGTGNFTARAKDNGADVGTIAVNSRFVKALAGTSNLDLLADRDVIFTSSAISTTIGLLNVQLNADRNANQDGAIQLTSSAVTTNGGYFVAGGGSGVLFGVDGIYGTGDDATSTGADNVAAWGNTDYANGIRLNDGDISTGAGALILNGHGANIAANSSQRGIVIIGGSILQTTSGSMLLNGTGGTGVSSNVGILLDSTVTTGLTTSTGSITLNGTGGAGTGSSNNGVYINDSSSIISTGALAGDIKVTGMAGNSGAGVLIDGSSNAAYITSANGDIYVTGTGTGGGIGIGMANVYTAYISSTGTTSDAANITMKGYSTSGVGIQINGNNGGSSGGRVTTVVGNIDALGSSTSGLGIRLDRGGAGTTSGDFRSSGSGNITLTATGTGIAGNVAVGTIGGANMTGILTIIADAVDLSLITPTTSATGSIVLKPYTASSTIGLGGGAGTLNLTDAELANITTGTLVIGDSVNGTGDIIVDSWDLSGKTHNVELYGNDITFQDTASAGYAVNLGTGNFTARAKDVGADVGTITANKGFSKAIAGSSKLDLLADRDILFTSANIDTSLGSLNVQLNSDRNADNDGAVTLTSSAVTTNGGYFVAGGGAGTLFGADGIYGTADDGASTGADNIAAFGNGTYKVGLNIASNINTGAGNIILNGQGAAATGLNNYGVFLTSQLTTSSGKVSITGSGGGSGTAGRSEGINVSAGRITTTSGDIKMIGNAYFGTSSNSTYGIRLTGDVQSNSGSIDIIGTGVGGGYRHGLAIQGTIASGTGNINLTGSGGVNLGISGSTLGDANQSGTITINANSMSLATSTVTSTGSVVIKPLTASGSIGLGGGGGTLNLTDAMLDSVSAGTLVIGDSANGTGDIIVDSWDLSGKTHNVELYGNDITLQDTASAGYAVNLGAGNFKIYSKDNGADVADLAINAAIAKALAGSSSLNLSADHNISFASGSNITALTGKLNVNLESDINYATVAGGAISVTGSTFTSNGGNIYLRSNGTSATTITNSTLIAGTGTTNITSGGALSYTSPNNIVVDTLSGSSVLVQTTGTSKNLTTNGQITATGAGNAANIAASGNFINGYGASLFNMTGGGRWLVYSTNPTGNVRNGLTPNAAAIYGGTYGTMAPGSVAAGNRFIFSDAAGFAPTITFTADNKSKTYGDTNSTLTYTVGGFVDADTSSTAYTGGVTLSTLIDQLSSAGAHTGEISITNNGLASNLGYQFAFNNGNYNIDKANLSIIASDASKTYGATKTFAGTEFTHSTLLNSDTISGVTLTSTGAAGTATVAGGPYAIVASNATGTGLSNYNITYTNGSLTVNKANLNITASDTNKTYGATKTFAGTEFTNGTLYNGDTLTGATITSSGAAGAATVAGGPYTIAISNVTGTGLGNYNISYTNGALTVDKANLTVTANDANKTYGSVKTFAGTEFTNGTLYNGDTLTGITLNSAGAGVGATVAGGPYAIIGSAATGTGLGNYNISYANGSLTVDKANLTVTANDANKIYGATKTFAGTELTTGTLYNGDTVTGANISSTGAAASANVAGGPYAIAITNATGSGLGNYNITYTNGSLTVDKANLSIIANDTHKTYGSSLTFNGTEYVNGTLYNGDTISGVTLTSSGAAGTATVAGGPYAIVATNATGTGLGNYNISYTNGSLTVDKANLLVSANNDTKVYGSSKTFAGNEFTHSTLYNSDTITGATITSSGAAATANVAGSPYAIVASNATGTGLDNYNITYASGDLTVNKASLTITANDGNKTYGTGYTFTGNEFSYSTLYNSDTVTGVTLSSTGTSASAGAGSTYSIVASNATGTGLANYNITYNVGSLIVDKASLVITAGNLSKTYGTNYTFNGTEYSASALLNSDSLTGVTLTSAGAAATANVTGSPYAIVASNATGTGLSNYDISYSNGALTVDKANLSVIANDAHKTYGTTKTFNGTEFIHGTLYNSDTITGATITSSGAAGAATVAGGPYAIAITNASGTGLGNYNITYTNGALTVDKANLIVTASDATKTYGATKIFNGNELTTSTLYNGDTVTGATITSSGAAATATVAGGPYTIAISNASGTGLGNYNVSYTNGALTVNKANLIITANDASKTYGTTKTFAGSEYTNGTLYNGDTISGITLISSGAGATANVMASPYAIVGSNASGTGLGNYNITYANGALTVDKANLTVTASDTSKVYGSTKNFAGTEFTHGTLYNSDTLTGVTLTSTGAASAATVAGGPYAIVASNATGTGVGNYNITYVNGVLSVSKANLTILADDAHKTYGSTKNFTGTEFINSILYNSDTIAHVDFTSAGSAATATVAGGPYTIVGSNATGTGLGNYNITYSNGSLTVDKANLIVSANNISKTYGTIYNFAGTEFTPSSLYNGDSVTHVNLVSAGANTGAGTGGYSIIASGATGTGLSNYNISYSNGILNIINGPVLPPADPVLPSVINVGGIINYASNITPLTVGAGADSSGTTAQNPIVAATVTKETDVKDAAGCMVVNNLSGGCAVH